MAINKNLYISYDTPEEMLLGRIIIQAIEDVERLPNMRNDTEFKKMRNDLWSFFQSPLFYEILDYLEISRDLKIWGTLRNSIWTCTEHKAAYIRPDRRK